jgi:N-acetyl-anhydromuramyl-L-alanine amidase AmpD
MADPPQPHGPYYQWTRKVAAKTVGRWLSPEQAADYQVFIDNHRRLRELFARLEAIGLETLETDSRTRHEAQALRPVLLVDKAWSNNS